MKFRVDIIERRTDMEKEVDYDTAIQKVNYYIERELVLASLLGQKFLIHRKLCSRNNEEYWGEFQCWVLEPESVYVNEELKVLNSSVLQNLTLISLKEIIECRDEYVEIDLSWELVMNFLEERHTERVQLRSDLLSVICDGITRGNTASDLGKSEMLECIYANSGIWHGYYEHEDVFLSCYPSDIINELRG